MQIQTMMAQQTQSRKTRRPSFPIAGNLTPYTLAPLWVHPVLPGETMQSVTQKCRTISMPIKHPMAGAWLENWLVYVKFTDLDRDLGNMFISDDYSATSWTADADRDQYFTQSGQIDWIKLCVERVHAAYFIHESETPRTLNGLPQIKLNNVSWYQNMMFKPADDAVPTTDGTDMYQHLQGWMMLQQMQLTELTYEKYLETYGAKAPTASQGDPEILRFARSWTQPVNTVEPTTGAPSSAWIWSDEIKADKPKRFEEPGFIMMLAAVRPKMYQANLNNMVGNLWGFSDWFPSYNLSDPTAGVKEMLKTDKVFEAAMTDAGTETLIYDHKDLLSHGEQFVRKGGTEHYRLPVSTGMSVKTGAGRDDIQGEYCHPDDIAPLFKAETAPVDSIYYEGMAMATISGHITDTTR